MKAYCVANPAPGKAISNHPKASDLGNRVKREPSEREVDADIPVKVS